jgi:phosphoglycerol transferase MdoB-like AlkP superfamily enzyme
MNAWLKLVRPFIFLLLIGALQRLFLFIVCPAFFESYSSLFLSLLTGVIYDTIFFSIVFIALILLSSIFSKKIISIAHFITVFSWIILNAFDLFSFRYLGVRASLNSFNLFSVHDLVGKISFSSITLLFIFFLVLFTTLVFLFRKKIVFNFFDYNARQKINVAIVLFISSFLYLPYPVNYYTDQLTISREARQLSLNPYYSWIASLLNRPGDYPVDKHLALASFKKQYGISESSENFLARKVNYKDSAYDCVVLIIMESFGANRVGALEGEKKLSPNFDALCREGTLYTRCFACGPRTQYGISSIMFGFPHILGYNLFRKNKLKLPFSGLPARMAENKYQVHFLHGGDASYDDMDLLLNADKPVQLKDADDIKNYRFKNAWGVDDESLFNYSEKYIQATGRNLYCLLTMSNHEPFQVPNDFKTAGNSFSLSEKTFCYSDYALGEFIKKLKHTGKYDKALIIITGDHGELYNPNSSETKLYHVPLLIIDHKAKGIMNSTICSHADIAEFILSKTAYSGKSHFIGQRLTGKTSGTYYSDYAGEIYKVTDSVIYRCNISTNKLAAIIPDQNMYVSRVDVLNPDQHRQIVDDIRSYYTSMRFIFENGLYHD